jgi:PAS domain S-box-containing protein
MLIYSKKKKILGKELTYLVLYTPSAVFFYLVWKTNLIIQEIGGFRWGYYDIPGKGFLFFVAYLQIYFFLGLYLCWRVYKKSSRMQEKKQAKCIFIGTLLSIIVGSVTDAILPIAGIPIVGLAATSNSILAMSIVYAIQKYKLMGITPQLAAEKIVNSMNDSLVAVDSDGTIVMVNKATENLLGYKGKELIGRPLETLFEGDKNRLENLSKGETIKKFRMRYLGKDKKSIPISLSVSEIRDKYGDFIGNSSWQKICEKLRT